MKKKTLSLRIFSVLLLICMLTIALPLNVVASSDCLAISVSDEHNAVLTETFTSVTNAKEYTSSNHVVDLPVGKAIYLDTVGVLLDEYETTWETSNADVVKIEDGGRAVAVGTGTATVKATSNGMIAELTVNVVSKLEVKYKNAKITLGNLCNLDLNVTGDLNRYLYTTEWKTSDGSIAQVGGGLVLAQKIGKSTITATVYDKATDAVISTATCNVEVLSKMSGISITNEKTSMELGSTHTLRVETTPSSQRAVWESSDPNVATVDNNGKVTATGVGTVTITAYAGRWIDNTYVKDDSYFDSFRLEIWSSENAVYNAVISNNQNGNVTISKNEALENEVIHIFAKDIFEKGVDKYEAKGAAVVSVTDESGHSVAVTKVGVGEYTFVMPKSNVTIDVVYKELYSLSVEGGLSANMNRNDNLVAKININEYVGGTFAGTFSISGIDFTVSDIVCDYAEVISNTNGKIVFSVNDSRTSAGKFVISVYADAQKLKDGTHGIKISGDANIELKNTFTSCNVGNVDKNAVEVDVNYVENNVNNKVVNISAVNQVVMHGEAVKYIQEKAYSVLFKFADGEIEVSALSFKSLSAENGGFTLFDFKITPDAYGSEDVFGTGALSIKTFTSSGLSQDQLAILGKVTMTIYTENNEKLTINVSDKAIESTNGTNVFEISSLTGFGAFSISMKGSFLNGDLLFILLIVLLILALLCAVIFLMKRLRAGKFDDGDRVVFDEENDEIDDDSAALDEEPITDKTAVENADLGDDAEVQEFRTVDDILRDSNLSDEADDIKTQAIEELKSEIARELSEGTLAENTILTDEQLNEIKQNCEVLGLDIYDALESETNEFKKIVGDAEDCRVVAGDLVVNENATPEAIHSLIEDLRNKTSVMIAKRSDYDNLCNTTYEMIEASFEKVKTLQDLKKTLVENIEAAREVSMNGTTKLVELKDALDNATMVDGDNDVIANAKSVYMINSEKLDRLNAAIMDSSAFCDEINVDTAVIAVENHIENLKRLSGDINTTYIVSLVSEIVTLCNNAIEEANRREQEKRRECFANIGEIIAEINNIIASGRDELDGAYAFINEDVNEDKHDTINEFNNELTNAEPHVIYSLENSSEELLNTFETLCLTKSSVLLVTDNIKAFVAELKTTYHNFYMNRAIDEYNKCAGIARQEIECAADVIANAKSELVYEYNDALNDACNTCVADIENIVVMMNNNEPEDIDAIRVKAHQLNDSVNDLVEHVRSLKDIFDRARDMRLEEEARAAEAARLERERIEEMQRIAAEEEAKRLAEEEAARIAAEEEAKRLAEEEAARIAAEEEAKRLAEEEAARIAAEEEAKRLAEEEAARIAAEEEAKRLAEEEAARIAAEEEAKRLAEEEAARIAAEEEAKRLAEEEAARIAAEEEAKRLAEEEAARIAAEEEAKRLAEEEAARIAAEEEAKRLAEEEAARIAAEKRSQAAKKAAATRAAKKAEAERIAAEQVKVVEESANVVSAENDVVVDTDIDVDTDKVSETNSVEVEPQEVRKTLIPRFETLLAREAEEYNKTIEYLANTNKLSDDVKKEYLAYLDITHKNIISVSENLDTVSNSMLDSLFRAMNDDIETMIFMRGEEVVDDAKSIQPSRLPRKKIAYWQSQMNSSNPYMSYLANTKMAAHKMRVRLGMQSHRANGLKQKNKKR